MIAVTTMTPVTISKPLRKFLSKIPVKRDMKELQKIFLLDTAQILQKAEVNQFPLQAWRDPTASSRLRLPYFMTIGT